MRPVAFTASTAFWSSQVLTHVRRSLPGRGTQLFLIRQNNRHDECDNFRRDLRQGFGQFRSLDAPENARHCARRLGSSKCAAMMCPGGTEVRTGVPRVRKAVEIFTDRKFKPPRGILLLPRS